jgi:hypothetical protein
VTKFTERELQVASGDPAAPGIDDGTTLLKVTGGPSACVINFFEARDRLQAGLGESSKEFEINRNASKVANRLPSVGRGDRLEESIYWLLSAATLVYLFLGITSR